MTGEPGLFEIFEADLQTLVQHSYHYEDLCSSSSGKSLELYYAAVVLHFLRSELDSLATVVSAARRAHSLHPEWPDFEVSAILRLRIRERLFDDALLTRAKARAEAKSRWRGEIGILIATYYGVCENHRQAQTWYVIASAAFARDGVLRKSLRCRMNALIAESHLNPDRNLLNGYHDLLQQALRRDSYEPIVITNCLLNLSREYQRTGGLLVALKYCNRALSFAQPQFGSLVYYLSLAHRAHLLFQLGRLAEAKIDLEQAQVAPFKEVQAAVQVVRALLQASHQTPQVNDLLPTWRERLEEHGLVSNRLSPLEEQLFAALARGPQSRIDLLDQLYGTRLDFETKANRFKSLLAHLRKKAPELILFENGMYRVSDVLLAIRDLKSVAGKKAAE